MTKPEDLEQLLQQMNLKTPSGKLDRAVQQTLQSSQATGPPTSTIKPWLTHVLTAAAALVVGVMLGHRGLTKSPVPSVTELNTQSVSGGAEQHTPASDNEPPPLFRTSETSRTVLGSESLVLLNGQKPVRSFETISSRTVTMIDERTGKESSIEIPVRRIVLTESFGI